METRSHGSQTSRFNLLRLKRMGIDTYQEPVVYMRADCSVCRSEGFEAQSRVTVTTDSGSITATLNIVHGDFIGPDEAGLSESAWNRLHAVAGEQARMSHPQPLESFRHVRGKVYGARLTDREMGPIIKDITQGKYSDIHLAAFITACGTGGMDVEEITDLTQAMVDAGDQLTWGQTVIADKHCVGGLPGNRTTPIIVAIVAASGLWIPKTSSRAITSPAGTADAMETLAPVDLNVRQMRRVVEQEGGCIVWGGSVHLSPADDILIRVERVLDIDTEGQLVASVISKKRAAGASHLVIDVPVGPTAKVRSAAGAARLSTVLVEVARRVGIQARAVVTDGSQPIGHGIGPALEARDVLSVLQNTASAPVDLRDHALRISGAILEMCGHANEGRGYSAARDVLASGVAWRKFQAICAAQGGMREPPSASHSYPIVAREPGVVRGIDNRRIALAAKLAGAPQAPAAGVTIHVKTGHVVEAGQPLFTLITETPGELAYALDYVASQPDIVQVGPQ